MCGEIDMWLSATRVFLAIDVVVVQHYFYRVLVIPGAVGFLWSGASDSLWLSLVLNPEGQWHACHVT